LTVARDARDRIEIVHEFNHPARSFSRRNVVLVTFRVMCDGLPLEFAAFRGWD
jgi:hypothetical protein